MTTKEKSPTTRIDEIVYKELCSPEGLSFPDILSSIISEKAYLIEDRLLAIVEKKQKVFDELLRLLGFTDKKILNLDNGLKIGIISRSLFEIYGIGKNG